MIGHIGAGPSITNLLLADKAQEYSHVFSPHVKKVLIQPRAFKDIRLAYQAGGTATNYLSLPSGSPYWEDNIIGPLTVYLRAESEDNVTAEIIEWSAKD